LSSEIRYHPWKSNQNQASPEWLLKIFEGWFDPCILNPEGLRSSDGLGELPQDITRVYIHPPYNESEIWVDAALKWRKKATVAMLLKADNSTKWFRKLYLAGAHILLFSERLQMQGQDTQAPFPSILVILDRVQSS